MERWLFVIIAILVLSSLLGCATTGLKSELILNDEYFEVVHREIQDAIIRLRKTGNPKALQYHLGHNTPAMTLRYLSTLTQEDALRVQQEVEFGG